MTDIHRSDRLTLIMPVRDRAPFVRRWFAYAAGVHMPYPLIVADGGTTGEVAKLLGDPGFYPQVRRTHVHYADAEDYGGFIRRIANALDLTETPYACFTADDDFPVVGGVEAALDYLDNRPDYLSARGDVMEFTIPEQSDCNAFGEPSFRRSGYFDAGPRDDGSGLARIARHCDRFCAEFLNVQRTDHARRRYGFMRSVNARETWLPGVIDDMALLAAGKTARLPELFALKHTNASGNEARNFTLQEPTLLDWMIREGWSAEMRRMVDFVSAELAEAEGMSREEAEWEFKRIFLSRYMNRVVRIKSARVGRALPGTFARRAEVAVQRLIGQWRNFRSTVRGRIGLRRHLKGPQGDELRAMIEACRNGGQSDHGGGK